MFRPGMVTVNAARTAGGSLFKCPAMPSTLAGLFGSDSHPRRP
jgi:hypothetical protein